MATPTLSVDPNTLQRILIRAGAMDSCWLGNETYHSLFIIDILVAYVGEDYMKQELQKEGKEWEKIKGELLELSKKVQKLRPTYDLIENKSFSKLDKEVDKKEEFVSAASKIPVFGNVATWLYVWFVKRSNVQHQSVKNEYRNYLEKTGFSKEVKKTKMVDHQATTESS